MEKRKLILCRGIQASGKSTWAKAWAKEDPEHRVRFNNDDIRNMLGELLTQSLRDVKANFLAIMETLPECFIGKCPFDVVLEVMEQLGFEELEHEINGWDLDYWATFTKGNLTYSVDGSHYYGNCKVEKVYDD